MSDYRVKPAIGEPLTLREYLTLATYAREGDQRLTAEAMGVGTQTVKNHLIRAYAKLGVQTNLQAFRQMGWLRAPRDDTGAAGSASNVRCARGRVP